MKEAMYYKKEADKIRCELCPHRCLIAKGQAGRCRVRKHLNGKLYATGYGKIISAHVDPIEKKPLYHFYPSKEILSVGFSSCNMTCPFCQNHELSQNVFDSDYVSVDQLIKHVGFGIAFTYNEPLINYEYILDFSKRLKEMDTKKKIVLVTNGLINEEPLLELLDYVDAFNLDIKGNASFYKECGGDYETVIRNMAIMNKKHLEVTTLMVTEGVSLEDVDLIAGEIEKINPKIPMHISRYFPQYQMTQDATSHSLMMDAKLTAASHLEHVYLGNVNQDQNTYCYKCHELLISRFRYQTVIKHNHCLCGYDNNIRSDE